MDSARRLALSKLVQVAEELEDWQQRVGKSSALVWGELHYVLAEVKQLCGEPDHEKAMG